MDELEMPEPFARGRVERKQAIGEEVCPDAIAAPEIKRRGTGRHEDDAALLVERHAGPTVRAADMFPSVRRPRFVAFLTGMRDRVKRPGNLPGADVIGADVPWRRWTRSLGNP
jgi:hypothetical protein